MRKVICFVMIGVVALCLASCATSGRYNSSDVESSDINADESYDNNSVETRGIGSEDNLVGLDKGPQKGFLGIRSFYFKFDSNIVNSKDVPIIKEHAAYLLDHPNAHVVIEGNTDIRGSREYNIGLGHRRSDSVLKILRMAGVSSNQIRTLSYGAERPIALGHNENSYRLNRRSDIVYEK